MSRKQNVLIVGEHGVSLTDLTERTRTLGFRVIRANSFEHAGDLVHERGLRYDAALLDPHLPIGNLWAAVRDLGHICGRGAITCIAVGPRPERDVLDWLRDSDIRIALWDPVGDHALRFQLNRAIAQHEDDVQRGAQRVPTEWPVRVFSGGREKPASIYSLSGAGAFLETRRPSVTGAELAIELPLPSGAVSIAGRVVYTNVPGNLSCDRLPLGMAVRFQETPAGTTDAILESVARSAEHFVV